jgi:antitoxin YefM
MVTTYKLNTKELESTFIDSIRTAYPDKVVEIQVREQDETEYLLSTPANRERMERILKEDAEGRQKTFETLEHAIQAAKQ